MTEVCGNCKYNKRVFKGRWSGTEFQCGNEDSVFHGCPTAYDDTCEDYEPKEGSEQE